MTKRYILIALSLVTACAAPRPAGPPPAAPPLAAQTLIGTQWQFIKIDGAAPLSNKAFLKFDKDNISANVGCNGMGGTWTLSSGVLKTGPFISTMMYCDRLMDQERAVGDLITASPTLHFDGEKLVLSATNHRAELVRLP